MKTIINELLWLTRWQLHCANWCVQMGQVWCNSIEAEIRNMENQNQ